jgi:hypothetical protein
MFRFHLCGFATRLLAVVTILAISATFAPFAGISAAGEDPPTMPFPIVRRANSRTPVDSSTIRGANYCYAEYGGHSGMWNNYSPAITERDLNYAQRLGINQIRCFITLQAYQNDPDRFRHCNSCFPSQDFHDV